MMQLQAVPKYASDLYNYSSGSHGLQMAVTEVVHIQHLLDEKSGIGGISRSISQAHHGTIYVVLGDSLAPGIW
jgi:hypothetical protein